MKILTRLLLICCFCSVLTLWGQQNIIPQPQKATWSSAYLSLKNGVLLPDNLAAFPQVKSVIDSFFKENEIQIYTRGENSKAIKLTLKLVETSPEIKDKEGYTLQINKAGISITALDAAGFFYAVQTLRQFNLKHKKIQMVDIVDQPAYHLRGFLVDVGRNFQPMEMLKQQLDVMAHYKLNLLHFHFTENVAWRLESKQYPGLTAASNMTRWKGDFYSVEDFKELIRYAKDRHITLLPEIDMPGHSEAFKRFFGVDMQSAEGIGYLKELLKEFRTTYPEIEMLHIGGDEVKITNPNFMPEITRYVESLGYQTTVGWSPGSNLLPETIKQLWMGGPEALPAQGVFIDSKHLYINHMDPLETVITLFYRKFGQEGKSTPQLPGAILCSWPDRAVAQPIDMFYQNAVYPALLTFAERSWRGGGLNHWVCNLPTKGGEALEDFKNFETRLLYHKDKYFKDKPFPYVKQTNMKWELIGPFNNGGDLSKAFPIEKNPYNGKLKVAKTQVGGTVILRHWWADILQGAIDHPKENTTWYARTKIWSNQAGKQAFWIGFNNLSRSYASDSPQSGTWDDRKSQVWVNGQWISPPHWKHAGMKGDLEKPLIDEGYAFRKPTMINLKKGWNTVLVKLPVGSFQGKNWQNPVKWMFTFVPISD